MMDGWLILQQSSGSSDEDNPIMKTKDERQKFQWKVQYSLGFPEKVSPPFRKKNRYFQRCSNFGRFMQLKKWTLPIKIIKIGIVSRFAKFE